MHILQELDTTGQQAWWNIYKSIGRKNYRIDQDPWSYKPQGQGGSRGWSPSQILAYHLARPAVNPIPTRGAGYAYHITTHPPCMLKLYVGIFKESKCNSSFLYNLSAFLMSLTNPGQSISHKQFHQCVSHNEAFTNYVYKIWLFLTTYPLPFTFSYKSLQKLDFFDHLPPSSCKRSLWTTP